MLTNAPGWVAFDITAIYQGWVSGAFPNFGVLFDGNTSTNNGEGFRYWSSDYADDPTMRPYLAVTYDAVPAPGSLLLLLAGLAAFARTAGARRGRSN